MAKTQFLDYAGLQELVSQIKAADDALELKIDSRVWSGTRAEYEAELASPNCVFTEKTVVIITDEEEEHDVISPSYIQNLFS